MQTSSAIARGVRDYWSHLAGFSRNARLFLLSGFIASVGMRMYDVVFNFYLVSLGYREDFLGLIASVGQGAVFFAALPAAALSERIGRKQALLVGMLAVTLSLAGLLVFTRGESIILMTVLFGAGLALAYVTMLPFMMENSTPAERTHLFTMNQAVAIGSGFLGGFVGGSLPGWSAAALGISARDPQAYQSPIALAALIGLLSLAPIWLMQGGARGVRHTARRTLSGLRRDARLIFKILLPNVLISLGAGLLIPFNNLFARVRFGMDDAQVGVIFSLVSLIGGATVVAAPLLASRFGKIGAVVLAQGLGVVMLALMGFSPIALVGLLAFIIRPALMQLSGPLFDAFTMEAVRDESRTTLASLTQMVWTVGMIITPPLSGQAQLAVGWTPIIAVMIAFYTSSVALTYLFFVRGAPLRSE